MNATFVSGLRRLVCGLTLGVALATIAPEADAQVGLVPRSEAFTNNTTSLLYNGSVQPILTTQSSNILSQPVRLFRDRGIAIWPTFATTNASTSNVVFNARPGRVLNGVTNWSTTLFSSTNALNGTTGVSPYWLIPKSALDNADFIQLYSIANSTALGTVFVSNVVWSATP